VVDQLVNLGFLRTVADLYELHLRREELERLDGWGKKSVENLLKALATSTQRPCARVLYALGIRHIGLSISQILMNKFRTIEQLKNADENGLLEIPGVGPQIVLSIGKYFSDEHNVILLERLKKAGLHMSQKDVRPAAKGPWSGKTVVLTGTLASMTRDEAKQQIEQMGGKIVASVSKKTDLIVVGANPGSKINQAQALGIHLLDEATFLKFIKQNDK
jgi:DNA ligase (NAD+)